MATSKYVRHNSTAYYNQQFTKIITHLNNDALSEALPIANLLLESIHGIQKPHTLQKQVVASAQLLFAWSHFTVGELDNAQQWMKDTLPIIATLQTHTPKTSKYRYYTPHLVTVFEWLNHRINGGKAFLISDSSSPDPHIQLWEKIALLDARRRKRPATIEDRPASKRPKYHGPAFGQATDEVATLALKKATTELNNAERQSFIELGMAYTALQLDEEYTTTSSRERLDASNPEEFTPHYQSEIAANQESEAILHRQQQHLPALPSAHVSDTTLFGAATLSAANAFGALTDMALQQTDLPNEQLYPVETPADTSPIDNATAPILPLATLETDDYIAGLDALLPLPDTTITPTVATEQTSTSTIPTTDQSWLDEILASPKSPSSIDQRYLDTPTSLSMPGTFPATTTTTTTSVQPLSPMTPTHRFPLNTATANADWLNKILDERKTERDNVHNFGFSG